MKKTLFTFMALLFIISGAAHAQSKKTTVPKLKGAGPEIVDCKPLRVGTFKTTIDGKVTIMKRTATTEEDYLDGSTVPVTYTVKWTGSCSYTLTPTPGTLKIHPEIRRGAIFTVETFLQNSQSYTQTISANYTKAKINMEVYKIK